MWRHGDVLIAPLGAIPGKAVRLAHTVLARGEVTGHSHRILERAAAELWELDGPSHRVHVDLWESHLEAET
jgi:hypothetical protein